MAGGSGTRLWPLSRPERPKQFLPLINGKSLLQTSIARISRILPSERILIIGDKKHAQILSEQTPEIPRENIILEPWGRDTAGCIGYGALKCLQRDSEAIMAVMPADHLIVNEQEWVDSLTAALIYAQENYKLVALGRKPQQYVNRFGYLALGDTDAQVNGKKIYQVDKFVEKPDGCLLQEMEEKSSLQSLGTFAWPAKLILEELKRSPRNLAVPLEKYAKSLGAADEEKYLIEAYENLEAVSIDYSVLENSHRLAAVLTEVERIDVGNFTAFEKLFKADPSGNVFIGKFDSMNAHNNIIYSSDIHVNLIEVDNLVVVVDNDEILICPKDKTAEIKKYLKSLDK